jgi:RXT2-like, N-terminal
MQANIFSFIDILCPLKQASELPDHPTLSQPYRSNALPTMIEAVDEKLRNERALLAGAHNLHRQFLGDSTWMPCGVVESQEDPYIFRPRPAGSNQQQPQTGADQAENYVNGNNAHMDTESGTRDGHDDIEMAEAPVSDADKDSETKKPKEEEEVSSSVRGLPNHGERDDADLSARDNENGVNSKDGETNKKEQSSDRMEASPQALDTEGGDTDMQDAAAESTSLKDNEGISSPEPPRRMTTRARANASTSNGNGASGSSRYTSPDVAAQQTSAHPMFLVAENIRPDKDFGLPPNEAEDTRRLLWSYIQKQEETVRGFTYMLDSLRKAEKLREDVFESCKAEGHIGEMSDGEDWYDREKWGLGEGEDLKKGADDDDVDNTVDEGRTTGKRGRRRQ